MYIWDNNKVPFFFFFNSTLTRSLSSLDSGSTPCTTINLIRKVVTSSFIPWYRARNSSMSSWCSSPTNCHLKTHSVLMPQVRISSWYSSYQSLASFTRTFDKHGSSSKSEILVADLHNLSRDINCSGETWTSPEYHIPQLFNIFMTWRLSLNRWRSPWRLSLHELL